MIVVALGEVNPMRLQSYVISVVFSSFCYFSAKFTLQIWYFQNNLLSLQATLNKRLILCVVSNPYSSSLACCATHQRRLSGSLQTHYWISIRTSHRMLIARGIQLRILILMGSEVYWSPVEVLNHEINHGLKHFLAF